MYANETIVIVVVLVYGSSDFDPIIRSHVTGVKQLLELQHRGVRHARPRKLVHPGDHVCQEALAGLERAVAAGLHAYGTACVNYKHARLLLHQGGLGGGGGGREGLHEEQGAGG